jgi:hypothetical protein
MAWSIIHPYGYLGSWHIGSSVREADADCDGYLNYWILQGRSGIIIYCCRISALVDVDAIKQKDVICWSMEKTCIFTVRGAYDLALLLKNQNRVAWSSTSNISGDTELYGIMCGEVQSHGKSRFSHGNLGEMPCQQKAISITGKMELDANCNLCGNQVMVEKMDIMMW